MTNTTPNKTADRFVNGADHTHPPATESPYVDPGPNAGPVESLVLDIGGDVGALILFADEGCLGREIDLSPVGKPRSHHTHTMIRRRRSIGREFIAGVYPELFAGDYTVWGLDGSQLGQVTIIGGAVSEFHGGGCGLARAGAHSSADGPASEASTIHAIGDDGSRR